MATSHTFKPGDLVSVDPLHASLFSWRGPLWGLVLSTQEFAGIVTYDVLVQSKKMNLLGIHQFYPTELRLISEPAKCNNRKRRVRI